MQSIVGEAIVKKEDSESSEVSLHHAMIRDALKGVIKPARPGAGLRGIPIDAKGNVARDAAIGERVVIVNDVSATALGKVKQRCFLPVFVCIVLVCL